MLLQQIIIYWLWLHPWSCFNLHMGITIYYQWRCQQWQSTLLSHCAKHMKSKAVKMSASSHNISKDVKSMKQFQHATNARMDTFSTKINSAISKLHSQESSVISKVVLNNQTLNVKSVQKVSTWKNKNVCWELNIVQFTTMMENVQSANKITRWFCHNVEGTVFWDASMKPHLTHVKNATLHSH